MPGFTTHYLFGLNAYKSLNKTADIKKAIYRNHSVYSLGLQGPDIFFYHLPAYLFYSENPGSIAHTAKVEDFLKHLLNSYKLFPHPADANIAKAYIMGFLGHYILDSKCHPYIYAKTRFNSKSSKYFGHHINLETEIDTELLLFFKHKKPSAFRQESTILFTMNQIHIITAILYHVYSLTYPELNLKYRSIRLAIRSMQLGIRLLRDPRGQKKVLVRKIEGTFIGYPVLSSMISSNRICFFLDPLNILCDEWQNPWDKDSVSHESFLDLMDSATRDYINVLEQANVTFQKNQDTALKALLLQLGNKSYHSGLSSTIPS